jgi:hypothetical protein
VEVQKGLRKSTQHGGDVSKKIGLDF